MHNSTHTLLSQQQAQISNWRDEAEEIGENIADEILDRLEIELEDLTKDGLIWDSASFIQTALLSSLVLNFDEVCEKWITRRLNTLSETMRTVIGQAWEFDTACTSIDNLRKGMRIRQQLSPQIEKVFENAKPGLFRMINRALKNDIDYVLEEMDKDAEADARKLCQCFHAARLNMAPEVAAMSRKLLRTALRSYLTELQETANRLAANQASQVEAA